MEFYNKIPTQRTGSMQLVQVKGENMMSDRMDHNTTSKFM